MTDRQIRLFANLGKDGKTCMSTCRERCTRLRSGSVYWRKWCCFFAFFWPAVILAQPADMLRALGSQPDALLASRTVRMLRDYNPQDFDAESRALLADILLNEGMPHRDQYFLLAGYLKMDDALRSIPAETITSSKQKRNYGLALLRTGDEAKTQQLLGNIRQLANGNTFVYDVVPMLVYTRNRDVFDLLIERLLMSDSSCDPPDPHSNGQIDCGYRLMESLAPVLKDFPFARSVSGDLDVDDYPAALTEVRAWLRSLGNNYEIIQDTY